MIVKLTHDYIGQTHVLIKEIVLSMENYNETGKEEQIKSYSVENLYHNVSNPSRHDLIYLDGNDVVAFTMSVIENYGEHRMLNWEWLGLRPKYRSTGISDSMWYTLERWAMKQNVDGVIGYSLTHNIPMFKYMSKLKFNVWTTVKNHWYGQDYFIWGKLYG